MGIEEEEKEWKWYKDEDNGESEAVFILEDTNGDLGEMRFEKKMKKRFLIPACAK